MDNTGQVIRVPPNAQATFPIIAAIRPKITVASAGASAVPTMWLNVPLAPAVWYPSGAASGTVAVQGTVDIGNVVTVDVANTVTVANPEYTAAAPDAFAIVNGGTPVAVFAPAEIVNGAVIKNPSSSGETLYIDLVNPAQTADPGTNGTTMGVAPGATYIVPGKMAGTVSANAITSGHSFSAYRF